MSSNNCPAFGETNPWKELYENGVQSVVAKIDHNQCDELTNRYSTHNYHPLPVVVTKGKDAWVEDTEGNKYIDCVGSYSAMAHGHLSEYVVKTAQKQLEVLTLTSRAVYTREMALFVKAVCTYTGMDMACPMNTGAEAVETAIKLARKWAYKVKGVPKDQAEIIVAAENFHGRTTTIVGFSTEAQYQDGFGPFTPGFKIVPFGDIEALKAAITPNTAAVLMEPIQAEAGILFPPSGFMAAARQLCTDQNVLLIWDEIQTGFCRTGQKFAWMHEDAEPDIMTLGKALGGGLFPVAATVGKKHVMEVFKPGDHGSTFGGNPIAAVIGVAAMAEMEVENMAETSRIRGQQLFDGFKSLPSDLIEEVRGRGLLLGLEVREGIDTHRLTDAFLENGLLTKETRHRTFRFAPPLTIGEDIVNEILERTKRALNSVVATV